MDVETKFTENGKTYKAVAVVFPEEDCNHCIGCAFADSNGVCDYRGDNILFCIPEVRGDNKEVVWEEVKRHNFRDKSGKFCSRGIVEDSKLIIAGNGKTKRFRNKDFSLETIHILKKVKSTTIGNDNTKNKKLVKELNKFKAIDLNKK